LKNADTRTRPPKRGKLALILAAEKLIALRGLTGASLREINEAAAIRNVSAAHYHFGSREGIVQGVLSYRLPTIQARRNALIAEMQKSGAFSNPRALVGALVWPLVEEMRPRPEGNYYLRFIEQMKRSRGDSPLLIYGNEHTPSWTKIHEEFHRQLGDLPAQLRKLRLRIGLANIVSGLASVEAWIEEGEVAAADLPLLAEIVIDGAVNAIMSPASAQTLARLRLGVPDLNSAPAMLD
jgi:AcrR family transcriptional regulator